MSSSCDSGHAAHDRHGQDAGFMVVQLLIVSIVVSILVGVSISHMRSARGTANNRAMQAAAQQVIDAVVAYNGDHAIVPTTARGTCPCLDRLMSPGEWNHENFKDPDDGLVNRSGSPYMQLWPESPYTGTEIRVHVNSGGGTPGSIRVSRLYPGASPGTNRYANAIRIEAWGISKGRTVTLVRRTFGAADTSADCGYGGVPSWAR